MGKYNERRGEDKEQSGQMGKTAVPGKTGCETRREKEKKAAGGGKRCKEWATSNGQANR
jgi:hypothetical protein